METKDDIKIDPARQDYQDNYQKYILYYCNNVHADQKLYNSDDLNDVCTVTFNGLTKELEITNWLITAYKEPTIDELLAFVLEDVLAWFEKFYVRAQQIKSYQFTSLTTDELTQTKVDSTMIGMLAFDITTKSVKYYDGSVWIPANIYAPSNTIVGDVTITGNLTVTGIIS